MRPAVVGTLLGTAIGALLWSCSVSRVSDDFKCQTNMDCPSDRVCTQNFCVIGQNPIFDAQPRDAPAVCPSICNGTCNFQTSTCTIVGAGGANITCPSGWNCNIECGTTGACGMISCTTALSCDITCSTDGACLGITCNTRDCKVECTGQQACGSITCTSGDCDATCSGSGACGTLNCGTGRCAATCLGSASACGTVNCANSCGCDVTCDGITNACPTVMNCPDDAPGTAYCTVNGSNGQRCSSSFASQCNNC